MKNTSSIFASIVAIFSSASVWAGPPLQEPIDVNVVNAPRIEKTPFARQCSDGLGNSACLIDLTDLVEIGEVRITHVSGQALDVGYTSSPRFSLDDTQTYINLPHTVNSLDTGFARDIQFSQSVDVVLIGTTVYFLEPDSAAVFFKIAGYVIRSSDTTPATASSTSINAASSTLGSAQEP